MPEELPELRRIAGVLEARFACLFLSASEPGGYELRAAFSPSVELQPLMHELCNPVIAEVFDTSDFVQRSHPGATGVADGVQWVGGVPLFIGNDVQGVLCVGSKSALDRRDAEFLRMACEQTANAIKASELAASFDRSQQELEDERSRLQLLLEINNSLVSKLNIGELFAAVSESLRRLTRHKYSQIVLFEEKSRRLKVAAVDFPRGKGYIHVGLTVPCQGSPAGVVFTSRSPLLIKNLERQAFPSDTTDRLLAEGVHSICLAPLKSRERVLGVISIGSGRQAAFSESDLILMSQVADQVAIAIENALAFEKIDELNRRLAKEKQFLEEELRQEGVTNELIGNSPVLSRTLTQLSTVATTNATVLITGETGTGKELLARAVHQGSPRARGPFIKLNCASIPATLLESELFGHAKGAFTGAIAKQPGRLELADGGTLFLDEIGELPLELQPKLLRVLQDKQFERLGEGRTLTVNVRLVAATNRDLAQMVRAGEFRSDLFYRLNVFPIEVPSLRERREDIPALVHYFVDKFSRQMQKRSLQITPIAMQRLVQSDWPGNIRELENFIERAVIISSGTNLELPQLSVPAEECDEGTLDQVQRDHILRIVKESGGVIGTPAGAAARLGVKRTTLYTKMRRLGISRHDFRSHANSKLS